MILLADWTATAAAVSGAVAAFAALVAIVYAMRAAEAGREAVRIERDLRVEDDHRILAERLWPLRQAAGAARDRPRRMEAIEQLRAAQTALETTLTMPLRVDLGENEEVWMSAAVDVASPPQAVLSAASWLTAALQQSWDAHRRQLAV